MAMDTQYRPGNPCVADLNGMFVGKVIYVCGEAHKDAKSFAIDLKCGPKEDDNIALHINPRFSEGLIVRNTRKDDRWMDGRETDGPEGSPRFPFKKGRRFGITVTCREDGYEIMANRYKVYSVYKHRIPFHLVTHVAVRQDCDIMLVCAGVKGMPLHTFTNPPRRLEIPFHNIRDRSVVFVGKPSNGSGRFSFDFCNPDENRIHFHFNPRLNERQIVRNSNNNGWGREERDLPFEFPFVANAPFQVKITVQKKQYEIEINGMHAFTYKKRVKALKDIREIQMNGEVEIGKVVFC